MNKSSKIGELMRKIRGKDSLRTAGEKTGISHNYLSIIEKGIDPRSGSPIKPSPDTLKAFSQGYNYPYNELMRTAGYLDQTNDMNVRENEEVYLINGYDEIMKEIALKYPGVDLTDPNVRNKLMKLIDVVLDDYTKKQ